MVKQPLLRSVLPDGTVVLLVVLHDERCAILRNNEMIHQAGGDADGIDGAVQQFMAMTQVTDVLGRSAETNQDARANVQPSGDGTTAVAQSEVSRTVEPTSVPSAVPPPAGRPANHA